MIAVAEAARNISCSGGIPVAITNCLNFGNPYNPEVYWQFIHALKGMGEACLKFDTPVTGGNVSFYNQSVIKDKVEPVYPTPTIGMLGIMESKSCFTTLGFKSQGDLIYVLGHISHHVGYSEYLNVIHGIKYAPAPYFNLDEEFLLCKVLQELIKKSFIQSAHDISEGGLFCCLAESCFENQYGFQIVLPFYERMDIALFGESQGRAVVSISPQQKQQFEEFLTQQSLPFFCLGSVTGKEIIIEGENFGKIDEYHRLYAEKMASYFKN
jgi:phosphoribosylformylglycinamidine synthase